MAQYFTDFSEYTLSAPPGDFSVPTDFVDYDTFDVISSATTSGKKLEALTDSIFAHRARVWDDAGQHTDSEVVAKSRFLAGTATNDLELSIRNQSGPTQFMVGIYNNNLSLRSLTNGSFSTISTSSIPAGITLTDWFYLRVRVNGSAIKIRIWQDGETEPGTWDVETTSVDVTTAGFAGFYGRRNGVDHETDLFGIGTNGDPAPTEEPSAGLSATINQTTETDTAQPVSGAKTRSIGQVSETDTAQSLTAIRAAAVAQVVETDLAQAIAAAKQASVGQATEQDAAQPAGSAKARSTGQATETDAAQPTGARKSAAVGFVTEADDAQPVVPGTPSSIGQVSETDTAQSVGSAKRAAIGAVAETDQALAVNPQRARSIGLVTESDVAQVMASAKRASIGQASETDVALSIAAARRIAVAQVQETDTAFPFSASKVLQIAQVAETDQVFAVTVGGLVLGYLTGSLNVNPALDASPRVGEALDAQRKITPALTANPDVSPIDR